MRIPAANTSTAPPTSSSCTQPSSSRSSSGAYVFETARLTTAGSIVAAMPCMAATHTEQVLKASTIGGGSHDGEVHRAVRTAVVGRRASSAQSTPPAGLPGVWQLVSRIDRDKAGKVVAEPSLGTNPLGYLIYDNAGHVAAQLSARDRPESLCEVTSAADSNNPAHVGGYDAYFGRYEVDAAA